ncbi:ROK family protein [Arthrobacter sp. 35W]|uniref:ROK family protein n=1 Tax=Arthrobacter sp. 35W TaxID=1132441 RepID=UPI001E5BFC45|nr:ROK family protein [Arthrobacter sp. 35W]
MIGIDIGGTKTRAVLCDARLNVLGRTTRPTPARAGNGAMVDTAADLARELMAGADGALRGVGVGAAGVVDHREGTILVASDSFVDWAGTPVGRILGHNLGVPVSVENDVNAFLAGEVAAGAARGRPNVLGITLGTGVGGAVHLDGRLVRGAHGAAGEIGHVPGFGDALCTCGRRGHLETLASGRSIATRYRERTGSVADAAQIAQAARTGDADALAVFADAGMAVGRAIIMVSGMADPDAVVIGGGVAQAWDVLEPSITRALVEEPPVGGHPISIARSGLDSDAVAIGACANALQLSGVLQPVDALQLH